MKVPLVLGALSYLVSSALGFGVTESGDDFIVDTSAGLVFTGKSYGLIGNTGSAADHEL